jgi:hypothetical protein
LEKICSKSQNHINDEKHSKNGENKEKGVWTMRLAHWDAQRAVLVSASCAFCMSQCSLHILNVKIQHFFVLWPCATHMLCAYFCMFKVCFDPYIFIQKPDCSEGNECDRSIKERCFPFVGVCVTISFTFDCVFNYHE